MSSMPVGLSRDLPPKRVMRANVGGQDLVVWRATNGEIAAWDNRCPHRGMALSHGFVRGNSLACLYHGWHYGQSGVCNYIPAHPDLEPPATICTKPFSVLESDGVIWVSTDGATKLPLLPQGLEPLRVFIAEALPDQVRRAAGDVAFAGQGAEVTDAGVYRFGAVSVMLLLNPLQDVRTQVTVLATPGIPVAQRSALSRWCEAMRRRAELQQEAAG